MKKPTLLHTLASLLALSTSWTSPAAAQESAFHVAPGFVVERVAGDPLVRYPMFACFDDAGRSYVAEGSGENLPGTELAKLLLGKITMLEDADGDGTFDTATTFADKLIFPAGVLWHDGALYVASPPGILRFEDTNGDGQADRRETLVSGFQHDGTGHDVHGPFFGPDGWLYWTDGLRGYHVETREGRTLKGRAALIWRCRLDGRDIEWLCGGGIDNPVELLFLPNGSLIGTMDQTPGDALLHYIEGGWYPSLHDDRVTELPYTGPQLGSVVQFSAALPAALCGFCRIRTDHFGADYRDSLITTQFNVHRMQQHLLSRNGSTYRGETKDFLISSDYNVRPTDVLEDADGSLIWVDMGAWYNHECPTAKLAKPDVTGSIYRIRRASAPPVKDPWGKSLEWDSLSSKQLVQRLDDPRPRVRDRAIEQLVKRGSDCVEELSSALSIGRPRPAKSQRVRGSVVFILSRIGTPAAQAAVRNALRDLDPEIRQIATHCVGVQRDPDAFEDLCEMVESDEPAIRLQAAQALGRSGRSESIPRLQASLRSCGGDRFLEHALIYALIRIDDPRRTHLLLDDASPQVRRAGLIALDQMPAGSLSRADVSRLLDTDDPELKREVLAVISKHGTWAEEILELVAQWLDETPLDGRQKGALTGAILAFCDHARVQQLVSDAFQRRETPAENRLLLLEAMARCRLPTFPASWDRALAGAIHQTGDAIQFAALNVVRSRGMSQFDKQLAELSEREDVPVQNRVAALHCVAPRLSQLDESAFAMLTAQLAEEVDPFSRIEAASALGNSPLNDQQLLDLADEITRQGPLIVPLLVPAYSRSRSQRVGLEFVDALKQSTGTSAITVDDLDRLLARYPAAVRAASRPLREQRATTLHEQESYLAELTARLSVTPGDAHRGREVFFSREVGCSACHTIDSQGGNVGPDLSQIGRFRRTVDLLEAIAVPSSTIVPGYRSFTVATTEGKLFTGLLVHQAKDAVYLRTKQLAEIRIARGEIETMQPSNASIMPQGLEQTMTAQQFSDLLEFLYRRR